MLIMEASGCVFEKREVDNGTSFRLSSRKLQNHLLTITKGSMHGAFDSKKRSVFATYIIKEKKRGITF